MKKITRATIKSFIKREQKNNNLYIKTKSSFSGMTDMVEKVNDNFRQVDMVNFERVNDFDIRGLWLVGHGGDLFNNYSDDNYIGYEIYNCCGTSIIAMKKLY